MPTLAVTDLHKQYANGLPALRGVTLSVEAGEFVALMGPSGCGKSTLLHLLGGMDRPTAGQIRWGDAEVGADTSASLVQFRRQQVGFVFQFFNLLPTLTALENVALPALLAGQLPKVANRRARQLLERVGLAEREDHLPSRLSGGEQQRAAIARALMNEPPLLLADEPTGSLDSTNGQKIIGLLGELHREHQMTVLLATHDPHIAAAAQRIIYLKDGQLVDAA